MKAEIHLPVKGPEEFVRFSVSQRMEHLLMIISFTGLVITGIPQKFFGADWAQNMIMMMGGIETTRFIHRVLAVMFLLEGLYHAGYISMTIIGRRFTPSMFPNIEGRDGRHLLLRVLHRPHGAKTDVRPVRVPPEVRVLGSGHGLVHHGAHGSHADVPRSDDAAASRGLRARGEGDARGRGADGDPGHRGLALLRCPSEPGAFPGGHRDIHGEDVARANDGGAPLEYARLVGIKLEDEEPEGELAHEASGEGNEPQLKPQ